MRLLCEMMYHAFVEIRVLGYQNKATQAARLASAFHNLPAFMYSADFDWLSLKERLEKYQQDYPREKRGTYDYIWALRKARKAT